MKYILAIVLAVLQATYFGCSKPARQTDDARFHDKRLILQAGDYKLTLGEINRYFADSKFENAQQEYDAKKEYAEKAFGRCLLIEGAKGNGLTADLDSATISKSLLRELYNREVMSKIRVTDNDVDEFFEKFGGEIEVSEIVVNDSTLADSLYQAMKKGADFEKLARDFSTDKMRGPKGGGLGYISFNGSGGEIMDMAFGLKPGEFSRPIRSGSNWLLIKIYDRIKNTPEDLAENKGLYTALTSQYLQRDVMSRFAEEVRSEFHYKVIEATVQMLTRKADSLKTADEESGDSSIPSALDTSCFAAEERRLPIAEYDGGKFTVDDYLDGLRKASRERPPEPRDIAALNDYLQRMTIGAMLELKAKKEKIDKEENFLSELDYLRGNILVKKMTGKIYESVGEVSEADAKKYYEEHPDKFYMPDQIRASVIVVKTKREAEDLLLRARNGANFLMLAREFSLDRGSAYEGGDIGFFTVARYTPIYQAGENLKKGELGGPVEYEGNWWIFKVTDRITKYHKSFDLARSNVYSQAAADARDKAMNEFFDKMKEKTQYVRDYTLLKENLFTGPLTQTGKESE